ncbi:MAG: LacI family DNA-binding transcriptional regulator [Planctomycetota bacterium]|nr:LacI family DNA-binding transcriptional regulator [Planctomycetota bacterium]
MVPKVRRRDVAEHAGVSEALVSYVLNNKAAQNRIPPQTAERVREAAAKLGYRPSVFGRALKIQKSNLLALVSEDLTDHHTTELFRALSRVTQKSGFGLFVMELSIHPASALEDLRAMELGFAEGIFLHLPSASKLPPGNSGQLLGKPACVVGRQFSDTDVPCVEVDNVAGAQLAIRHLCEAGAQRIGVVADRRDYPFVQERLDGCAAALKDFKDCAAHVYYRQGTEDQYQAGIAAVEEWRNLRLVPDAVFAMGDMIAVGVLHALHQSGIPCPQRIKVVGFDGLPLGRYTTPSLSTIQQPYEAMAEAAFDVVRRGLAGEPAPTTTKRLILVPSLVTRESSSTHPARS